MFLFHHGNKAKDVSIKNSSLNDHLEKISREDHSEIPAFLLYPEDPVSKMMFKSKMIEIHSKQGMYQFMLYTDVAESIPEIRKHGHFAIDETHIYSKIDSEAWYSVSILRDSSVVTSQLKNSVETPDNLGRMMNSMIPFLNLPTALEEKASKMGNAYQRVKMIYLGECKKYNSLHDFDESHVYCHIFYLCGKLYKKFILCAKKKDISWKIEETVPSEHEELCQIDLVPPGQTFGSFFST